MGCEKIKIYELQPYYTALSLLITGLRLFIIFAELRFVRVALSEPVICFSLFNYRSNFSFYQVAMAKSFCLSLYHATLVL